MFLEFLHNNQLDIMLYFSAICTILVPLTCITRSLSRKRKAVLIEIEVAAAMLLMFDRFAYIYRGDVSETGYWMVRISNFIVYSFQIYLVHGINQYLCDIYSNEGGVEKLPKRLRFNELLVVIALSLIVVSQFTGLYYSFDAQNVYHRAAWMPLCYLFPTIIIVLQLSVIIQYRKRINSWMFTALMIEELAPLAATFLQFFAYGLSLTNLTTVFVVVILFLFAYYDLNETADKAKELEIRYYRDQEKQVRRMFEQTAEALATAIDAKDPYTHGHSTRVAEYSRMIAKEAGANEEQCNKVYYSGLLHDVGKIGVPDSIINKDGKLTDEEYAQIKMHPVYGNNILSRISELPYLSIGAHYHHERYDGRGYPDGLKGDDIPDIARIIAVADAYDAMTSKRSYRDPIPQQKVREEIVKGMGTQFDPMIAELMLKFMDEDTEYKMQEGGGGHDSITKKQLHCDALYEDRTDGIQLSGHTARLRLYSTPDEGCDPALSMPSIILYDSLDGRVHTEAYKIKDLMYHEYARIRLDGEVFAGGIRGHEKTHEEPATGEYAENDSRGARCDIEAVRAGDHLRLRISSAGGTDEVIIALPDSVRFAYMALTGENCTMRDISFSEDEAQIADGAIRRIAPEVSYIAGEPEGDIPNIEIDGWRSKASEGIALADETVISFHTMSLPTARLIWHCPFVSLFTSDDGTEGGEGYREFVLIRLDGESWNSDEEAVNRIETEMTDEFGGWNSWKDGNRKGYDCTLRISRSGNNITLTTENLGLKIASHTEIKDGAEKCYAALTGDECAITDIRISYPE